MIMAKRFPLPPLVQGPQLLIFISAYPGDQSFEDWKAEAIHTIKECWTRVCIANSWNLRKDWKKALTHSSSMNFPKRKTSKFHATNSPTNTSIGIGKNLVCSNSLFSFLFSFWHAGDCASQGRTQKIVLNVFFTSETPKPRQTDRQTVTRA